ncbi:MAG: hypothetical protein J6Q68_04020 [Clostridia bacterium]|nr:hypothetical protein [Clostridia bacterium]
MSKNEKTAGEEKLARAFRIGAPTLVCVQLLLIPCMCVIIALAVFFAMFSWGYWARYLLIPSSFPYTSWTTEDGDIRFDVDSCKKVITFSDEPYDYLASSIFGTATIDGVEYDFFVDEFPPEGFFRFVNMDIVDYYEQGGTEDYDEIVEEYTLFCATSKKRGLKKFVCSVYMLEDGGLLPEGTEIEFYRE